MSATKIRGLNNIYKKYNLPEITTAIRDNPDNVSNLMTANRAKIRKYHSDIAERIKAESLARIDASKPKESTPRASAPVPSPTLSLRPPASAPASAPVPVAGGASKSPVIVSTGGGGKSVPYPVVQPVPYTLSELQTMVNRFENVVVGRAKTYEPTEADIDSLKIFNKHFEKKIDGRSTLKSLNDRLDSLRLELGQKGSPLKAASKGASTPVGKSGAIDAKV